MPNLVRFVIRDRQLIAELRLVATAARWRANGSWAEVDDPFGDRMLRTRHGDQVVIYSVGENGRDNGGDGQLGDDDAADIALRLNR